MYRRGSVLEISGSVLGGNTITILYGSETGNSEEQALCRFAPLRRCRLPPPPPGDESHMHIGEELVAGLQGLVPRNSSEEQPK